MSRFGRTVIGAIRLEEFFEGLRYFLTEYIQARAEFSQSVRLVPGMRRSPDFQIVKEGWNNLGILLQQLRKGWTALRSVWAKRLKTTRRLTTAPSCKFA